VLALHAASRIAQIILSAGCGPSAATGVVSPATDCHRGMSAERCAMMRSGRTPLQQAHAAAAERLMSDARDWHSTGPLLSNLHSTFVHQGAYFLDCQLSWLQGGFGSTPGSTNVNATIDRCIVVPGKLRAAKCPRNDHQINSRLVFIGTAHRSKLLDLERILACVLRRKGLHALSNAVLLHEVAPIARVM
jgi:hypothetical protein